MIKGVREVNRVLKKVREKESKVVFTKIGEKEELCVMGVSDASYHHDDRSVAGEMIMLGNQRTGKAAPMYWRSGVIRKVCVSPKAAETRALLRLMDDAVHRVRNSIFNISIFFRFRPHFREKSTHRLTSPRAISEAASPRIAPKLTLELTLKLTLKVTLKSTH